MDRGCRYAPSPATVWQPFRLLLDVLYACLYSTENSEEPPKIVLTTAVELFAMVRSPQKHLHQAPEQLFREQKQWFSPVAQLFFGSGQLFLLVEQLFRRLEQLWLPVVQLFFG